MFGSSMGRVQIESAQPTKSLGEQHKIYAYTGKMSINEDKKVGKKKRT